MNTLQDLTKAITAEDLIRRYNLDSLGKDRKAITTLNDGLTKLNTTTEEFIEATLKDLDSLQSQVDGNISTWFFNGVPTLDTYPSSEWITVEERNKHLGDLYYDQDTGYAYRFALNNNEFTWLKLEDSDIVEALAVANAAQDTADSKRRVFVVTPTPPYDVGDIWIKDDKDLYRCRATRSEGDFSETDWILATDYTNDDYAKNVEAVLDQFKTTVETDYATKVALETTSDSINAMVESETKKIETTVIGNYEELTDKMSELATIESVQTVTNRVEQLMTDTYTKTEIQQISSGTYVDESGEEIAVSAVKTTTGTFDENGMHYAYSDSDTESTINYRGLEISKNKEEILFAGLDENPDSLTYGSSIVRSDNLTVNNYLVCGGSGRIEEYTDENGNTGPGFFVE